MNYTSISSSNRIELKKVYVFLIALFVSIQIFAQPANDDCSTAALLTAGSCCSMSTFTTVSATASTGEITPSCGGYTGGDVWFQVVVPASGHLVFSTMASNSSADGSMSIYSGACGALTEIQCSADNGTNLDPFIDNSSLTPGSTVYIRYWQAGGGAGADFNICVFAPTVQPPCTNLGFEDSFNGWTGTLGNSVTGDRKSVV